MAIYELNDLELDAVSAGSGDKPGKGVKISRVNAGNVLVNANVSPALAVGGSGFFSGGGASAGTATSQSNNVSNDNL